MKGRGEPRDSFQDLRSFVGRFLSGQEQKFIASMRGTCGYLERRISSKIRERRIREIKVFGFRKLPTHVSKLQEGGNSSYFFYFPSLG